jgi:hypothetical protein
MSNSFKYKVPISSLLPGLFLTIIGSIGFAMWASSNEKGLRLYRILTFTQDQASMIYWFFSAVFVFGAILFLALMSKSMNDDASVDLSIETARLPRASLKKEIILIPYKSINSINIGIFGSKEMIFIKSSAGDSTLSSNGFSSKSEFNRFKTLLNERLNG